MQRAKKYVPVVLYAAAVAAVLVFRLLDHRTEGYFSSSVYYGLYTTLELCILLVWLVSVRRRLLPAFARACIVTVGLLFLFFLAVSTVNYRIADQNDLALKRFCWYLYYIPLLGVPALFLATCMSFVRGKRAAVRWGAACLSVSAVLFAFVITNDIHYLVFIPEDPNRFLTSGGYGYGPVYYVGFVFVALEILFSVSRLALLFRKRLQLVVVLLPLLLMPCFIPFSRLVHIVFGVQFLAMPQFSIFCMACFFECCIRFRLIPYNENYTAFFNRMRFPAVITDDAFTPVYCTAEPMEADKALFAKALSSPVYVTADLRLSGKPLKAGSVFYTEDESELNRMNERLSDANELLSAEQTLIKAENDLKEQNARTESRRRIYTEISERTYSRQQEIAALLNATSPGAPDFDRVIARVNLLNAWVKRSANLLLVNEDKNEIDANELLLALEESARYLVYLGVRMEVTGNAAFLLPRRTAFALYETFERIAEACLPGMTRLFAALSAGELRLVTDAALPAGLPDLPMPVKVKTGDGLTYFSIGIKGGQNG